jgi:nucleoside-diphosphate-sugar epimerase
MLLPAMRVLVVGGTRFLGPPVVTRLSNLGHEVTVFHRGEHEPSLPFGVRHVHAPEAASPVVAFPPELTELAWDIVLSMMPVGERDARALVETFRGITRRLVALSSGDVYRAYGIFSGTEAGPPERMPLAEDAPLRENLLPYSQMAGAPADLAEYEKILVEHTIFTEPSISSTVLRLPAVYGPGDRQHRFASAWRRIADGRREIVLGRRHARFRWTHGYVDDVADAIVLAVTLERAKGRVYNVGEERTPTIAERIEAFGRALGWDGRVVAAPEEELPPHLVVPGNFAQDIVYDTSRIRRELDWRENASAEDAFGRTAAWEKESAAGFPHPSDEEYAAEDRAVRSGGR